MFNFLKKKSLAPWAKLLNSATKSMEEKNFENAIKFASEAANEIKTKAPKELKHLAWVYFLWGRASLNLQKFAQAEMPLTQSYQIFQQLDSTDDWEMETGLQLALGQFFFGIKKFEEARELFQRMESQIGDSSSDLLDLKVYIYLAEVNEKLKDYKNAIIYFDKYLEALVPIYGKEQSNYHEIMKRKNALAKEIEWIRKG